MCSLTQQCTVSCSILVSYVRCFVLGDVLGLCGSVPEIAAMCASFFWQRNYLFSVDILGRLDVLLSFHVQ